jgi:type IV pilus assembly protein PilE
LPTLRRTTLTGDRGLTLVELLVTLLVISVLVAIALPSYLSARGRAADQTAKANLREAMPAAEAYFADARTYSGLTLAQLRATNSGLSRTLRVRTAGGTSYCLYDTVRGSVWSVLGPRGSFYANNRCR